MRELKFRVWSISRDGKNGTIHYLKAENSMQDLVENERWKVMQYTGLEDKNGKEIYEGDILIHDGGELPKEQWSQSVVKFADGTFFADPDKKNDNHYVWEIHNSEVEIIGNIYENPELLRKKDGR